MAKKRHIVQYRERLDRTLASPDLTNGEMLKTLVKSQLLRSSQFEIEGYEDKFVETKTAEITNFLDMISASVDNSGGSSISHTDWKLKQDNEDYRVMYREGPEGTPFHTLMVEGYIDGPVDVCLCLSWEAPLYKKWWPQFTVPPFKVLAADCLQKVQIGEQISLVRMKVPWPLSKREAIVHYYLVEYFQEDLTIVLIKSVSESESMDGAIDGINRDAIPEAKDVVRIDFVGGYVLQKVTSERSYFRTMANLDIKLDFVYVCMVDGRTTMTVLPLLALFVAALVPIHGGVFASTVPAFLWSSHYNLVSDNGLKESVNYQVISPKDLAKSVSSEAGWSNFLCKGNKFQEPLDLALLFIGGELQSSDLSVYEQADSVLLDLLEISFARSNTSMAFPYVSASEDVSLEDLLVSGFTEACGDDLGIGNIASLGSCSRDNTNHEQTGALHSVQDYLTKRKEESHSGKTDLVMFCNGHSQALKNVDRTQSEGEVLSELIRSVEESGAKYAVLYVSDPSRSIKYPSYRELQRFLAESTNGNESSNATICNPVCQLASSLLEGLIVGIVLLIILISGLCCMMGIDTPTRFETPQES